jgi:hypothetical protein
MVQKIYGNGLKKIERLITGFQGYAFYGFIRVDNVSGSGLAIDS